MDILIGLLLSLGVIDGSRDINAQISRNQAGLDRLNAVYQAGDRIDAQGRWVTVVSGDGIINRADIIWVD